MDVEGRTGGLTNGQAGSLPSSKLSHLVSANVKKPKVWILIMTLTLSCMWLRERDGPNFHLQCIGDAYMKSLVLIETQT